MIQRNEAKILVPVISAYAEGRILQYKDEEGWRDIEDSEGLSINTIIKETENYRIKPEVKFRPFANVEECWTEMKKHQPFGWVKDKKDGYYVLITAVDNGDYMSLSGNSGWSFYSLMKDYTFTDDIPFGIKVE